MPLSLSDVIDETAEPSKAEEDPVSEEEEEEENEDEVKDESVQEMKNNASETDGDGESYAQSKNLPKSPLTSAENDSKMLNGLDEDGMADSPVKANEETASSSVVRDTTTPSSPAESSSPMPEKRRQSNRSANSSSSSSEDDSSSEDEDSEKEQSKPVKKKMRNKKTAESSSSEDDSSSEDEDSDPESKPVQKKMKKQKTAEEDDSAFADHPDPKYLDQLSDEKLSRQDLAKLKWWSYLIVLDKRDRSTWKLPYRDMVGRLNRPLLAHTRQILTDQRKVDEMQLLISRQVLEHAKRSFHIAWPGQPVKLVKAVDAPLSSLNPIQSVQAVIEESLAMKKKLDAASPAATANGRPKRTVVEVESDAAPTLAMKIRARRQQLASAPVASTTSASTGVKFSRSLAPPPITKASFIDQKMTLILAARRKLADDRQLKRKVDKEVQDNWSLNNQRPTVVGGEETSIPVDEEKKAVTKKGDGEDSDEADEDWKPDEEEGSEDDDDVDDDEENENEEEDTTAIHTEPVVDEEELDAPPKDKDQSATTVPEARGIVHGRDAVSAQLEEAQHGGDVDENFEAGEETANPPLEETEQEEGDEKKQKDRAGKYRAMLEAEAMRAATKSKSRFLENEAEEEEEEDQVGNYGLMNVKEKVIGLDNDKDSDDDDDEKNLMPTEDDLKAIVDTNSDDEGEDDKVRALFGQQEDEKDQQMLRRVNRDVENGTFNERRRKLIASGVQRALEDADSDSDSDEELDQARQKRFEDERRLRSQQAAAAHANGKGRHLGETEEDIRAEEEQEKKFLEMARKLKRSASLAAPSAGSAAVSLSSLTRSASLHQQEDAADEDARTVMEAIMARSSSQSAFDFTSNPSSQQSIENGFSLPALSRSETSRSALMLIPSAANAALKRSSTLLGSSSSRSSTVATMTNSFVYTKKVVTLSSTSSKEEEEQPSSTLPAAPPTHQVKRARTVPQLAVKKRRVALQPVPAVCKALLAPVHLQSTAMTGGGSSSVRRA